MGGVKLFVIYDRVNTINHAKTSSLFMLIPVYSHGKLITFLEFCNPTDDHICLIFYNFYNTTKLY